MTASFSLLVSSDFRRPLCFSYYFMTLSLRLIIAAVAMDVFFLKLLVFDWGVAELSNN